MSSSVQGAEEVSQVEVACPELSDEERAAIEARQLGELKTRGGEAGVLKLTCEEAQVIGVWTVGQTVISERTLSRMAGEDPTELLHWLAAMLIETREERAMDEAPAVPPPVPPKVTLPASEAEPTAVPSEDQAPSSIVADDSRDEEHEPDAHGRPWKSRFEASISAKYQHYNRELIGSLGPALSGGARFLPWLSVGLEFSPQFSLRRTRDFSATDWTSALHGCVMPLAFAEACAGAALSVFHVNSPDGVTTERATSLTGGGEVLVRVFLGDLQRRYFLSGGMRGLGARREVLLDEEHIASVPAIQAIFSLGVTGEPFAR